MDRRLGLIETCETCCFFSRSPNNPNKGQCRSRSPQLVQHTDGALATVWPYIRATDWCGDHGIIGEGDDIGAVTRAANAA